MSIALETSYRWLRTGDEAFTEMLKGIDQARTSVRLEIYIFAPGALAERFRAALIQACQRQVKVRVLIDAWGSFTLSEDFWIPFRNVGGECRWFNPFQLRRLGFRDHRRLLVCDDRVVYVGGFNIAPEYEGDGITKGWWDLGMRLEHPVINDLAASFDLLYEHADFRHRRFARWRKPAFVPEVHWQKKSSLLRRQTPLSTPASMAPSDCVLLLNGPGRGFSSFKWVLHHDLARARSAAIITAYFLPTWRIRRELFRLARRGVQVRLLFAGKSDVPMAQRACQRLYTRMLKAGIEIYEYQPQILHAKMILIDDLVYIGSSNLDVRSLNINYELMLRMQNPTLAGEASEIFNQALSHSRRVQLEAWRANRSFWARLRERWAYFILARLDPYCARWQLRHMR